MFPFVQKLKEASEDFFFPFDLFIYLSQIFCVLTWELVEKKVLQG